MELNILTSQKGTRVVTATNLHLALGLNNTYYGMNIKKWLNDVYEFHDGIRRPQPLKDFAKRKQKDNTIISDYYLSLELAKAITLRTNSKSKLKYSLQLQAYDDRSRSDELVSKEEVAEAIELARLFCFKKYQEISERQHLRKYESRNGGSAANWWKYRAQILGYSVDSLRKKAEALGKKVAGKSQKQILDQIDKYELIRTATIDLFMALDKNEKYARKMGDLAKAMAQRLRLTIKNDNGETTQNSQLKVSPLIRKFFQDIHGETAARKLQRA